MTKAQIVKRVMAQTDTQAQMVKKERNTEAIKKNSGHLSQHGDGLADKDYLYQL